MRLGDGRISMRWPWDPVFLHLLVEQPPVDVQEPRGLAAVPAGLAQGFDDHVALDVGQDGLERHAAADERADIQPPPSRAGRRPVVQLEMIGRDDASGRQHDRALNRVLELPDVARPVAGQEPLHRVVADLGRRRPRRRAVLVEEVRHEGRDVLAALAQRRQGDADDVQPVVQVLPEPAAGDVGFEVAVRRRQHARVGRDRHRAADALELAELQGAQELLLGARVELADLVEEDRPAVGQLEAPLSPLDGAGEGALLVAEQLAFEQRLGQRGAVDAHQGPAAAGGVLVDRLGHQLFAGAGLAGDEHRRVAAGHAADELVNRLHRGAAADDALAPVGARERGLQLAHLARQAPVLERAIDRHRHRLGLQGFDEVVVSAGLDGTDRARRAGVGGDDDDRHVDAAGAELRQDVQPVAVGQPHVQEHEVRPPARHLRQRACGGLGLDHRERAIGEKLAHELADGGVVVDDEDGSGHGRACTICERIIAGSMRNRQCAAAPRPTVNPAAAPASEPPPATPPPARP